MKIAVSGYSGCGNSTVTSIVARKLGLKQYNYTMTNLSQELGISLLELHQKARTDPQYDLLLEKKQLLFVSENPDCVVGTRLAVFLPQIAPKLKLAVPKIDFFFWLTARQNVRAERVAKRKQISVKEALEDVRFRDAENKRRYYDLYGIDFKQPVYCTAIDTEKFDAEGVAEQIIKRVKKA